MEAKPGHGRQGGKLRIGDDWNAITIIALSQQSPLKAVAELVENSMDARAGNMRLPRCGVSCCVCLCVSAGCFALLF